MHKITGTCENGKHPREIFIKLPLMFLLQNSRRLCSLRPAHRQTSTAKAVPLPGGGKCLRVEIRAYLHGIQEIFATTFARARVRGLSLFFPASAPFLSFFLLFLFFLFPSRSFYLAERKWLKPSADAINCHVTRELFIKIKSRARLGDRGGKSITQFSIFNGLRRLRRGEGFHGSTGWQSTP